MKEKALRILLVEDNAGDVRLLREMFSKEKPDSFEVTHLLRMSEAEFGRRVSGHRSYEGRCARLPDQRPNRKAFLQEPVDTEEVTDLI